MKDWKADLKKIKLNMRLDAEERESRPEPIDGKGSESREESLKEADADRLAREGKKLMAEAKRLIKDRLLVVCASCKDGRVEIDCPNCDGTGEVDPYIHPVIKQVIEGAHSYIVKSFETRTKCPAKKCHSGVVFEVCPHCAGLRISNKAGKPLHARTREKTALVGCIRELLGLGPPKARSQQGCA